MESNLSTVHKALPPRKRFRQDWLLVLALAAASITAVGLLYLIARDKPSAGSNSPGSLPVPRIAADRACANFANYWMNESGVDVDSGVVQGLTNCWLGADGEWFLPIDSNDERLPDGLALSERERDATAEIRSALVAQIADLERSLTNSMLTDLENIYDPNLKAVSGHVKEPSAITRPRSRYTRVAQSFLIAPEYGQLADYVGWMMSEKISAYETLRNKCVTDRSTEYLRTVCRGLEDTLSVWYPPWIWDLRDPVALDAYLAHVVRQD